MNVLVLTGDHQAADAEKPSGAYGADDLRVHQTMVEAFATFDDMQVEVVSDHRGLLERLAAKPPDLLINFCDTGFQNRVKLELHIPAYCELLGIPYSGAPPAAIALCYDKALVRLLAQSENVPVPLETYLRAGTTQPAPTQQYPIVLKPNTSDGSFGITRDAVVKNEADARDYLKWLKENVPGRDILAQEYLSGDEFGVKLMGNPGHELDALAPLQVDYTDLDEGLSPILAYESKVDPHSPYWRKIRYQAAGLGPKERDDLVAQCRRLFARLGLQDYARFDFRRGSDGTMKLLEVNPNPAWECEGKMAMMAGYSGMEYRDMLRRIIDVAWSRARA